MGLRFRTFSVMLSAMLLLVGVGPSAADPLDRPRTAEASASTLFRLPLPPPPGVLTPFRPPSHRYGPGHRGVDLAATAGDPVVAAASGTVVYAGRLVNRGVVSIEHPSGLRTTYEPVTAAVRSGSIVTAGSVIGTLEEGHPSCAPADCLHWGARLPGEVYLDPLSLLAPLPVRLLPWAG